MPHFPPSTGSFFFGQSFPNFSVKNDRVLDNLRVKQPNTFKAPPATPNLINPNVVDPAAVDPVFPDDYFGSNDPATNATLRSGVAQAGALVYSTTPIINPGGLVVDGCFDGRNHLYFSDGDQWIPLANCLPKDANDCLGPQYAEAYSRNETVTVVQDIWTPVPLESDDADVSSCFTFQDDDDSPPNQIIYTGDHEIAVKVTVSVSWRKLDTASPSTGAIDVRLGVGKNGADPPDSRTQVGSLNDDEDDTGSPAIQKPFPRNATVSGIVKLVKDDYLDVQVLNDDSDDDIFFEYLNFSVVKLS